MIIVSKQRMINIVKDFVKTNRSIKDSANALGCSESTLSTFLRGDVKKGFSISRLFRYEPIVVYRKIKNQ